MSVMCGVCGVTLTKTKDTLRQHEQRHKNKGKCSECGKDAGCRVVMRIKTKTFLKWVFVCVLLYGVYLLTTSLKIEASGNHSTDSFVSNDYLIHIENNGGNHGNRIAVKQFASSDNATFKASVFLRLSDVPRAVEYCNSPFKPVTGSEGAALKGFRLRSVHIFLRHGDRTPVHQFSLDKPKQAECNLDSSLIDTDKRLKDFIPTMLKFIGKQPEGNYFKNWAIFPNQTMCDETTLTGFGAVQHLKIGQHFQSKYLTQSSIFDKELALTSQIYTRSSVTSRTYQSAIAFLYGFLPHSVFNLANLRISHSDSTFCYPVLSRQKSCFCSYGNLLAQKIHNARKYFISSSKKALDLVHTVADLFGFRAEAVASFSRLMDAFSFHACHNQSNPCSPYDGNRCLSGEHYEQIWDILDGEGVYLVQDSEKSLAKYSHIILYPLMIEIANRLKDQLEGRSKQKMVIYSGHDVTITPLLQILGLNDGKWVRFAGRVVIELYEARSKKDRHKHYLRFLYNGKDLTHDVSFCKGNLFKGLCKFRFFYDFVFTVMLQQFGYTSYYDACSRTR